MKFKKLKSQSGRSMVEMLGVLAIIGVLSVGGIAGYSLSMRRHRANGVVDLMSKYALVVYGECQQRLMNKEVSTLDECTAGPNESFQPTYPDSGIGNLPAGVYYINGAAFSYDEKSGADIVTVSAHFDDDKLCQAVSSITGSTCKDSIVDVNFKQN